MEIKCPSNVFFSQKTHVEGTDETLFSSVFANTFPLFPFTGKEKDSETGYYYHGARYYDPTTVTGWTTVDPMLDKYLGISPYAYCAWNPMKYVDPDGREIDDYFSHEGKYLGRDNSTTNNVRVISESNWKTLEKDNIGQVKHDIGNILSTDFSYASQHGMSIESQLSVYEHYNMTGCKISASGEENPTKPKGGMTTIVGLKNNRTTTRIEIKLSGNVVHHFSDNADNIISMFVHEYDHVVKARKMGYKKYSHINQVNESWLETSAIQSQFAHPSWGGTSTGFKKAVYDYLKKKTLHP